jgi:hypothetical protein
MTFAHHDRFGAAISYFAFGIAISTSCFAEESSYAIFLDSSKSIEQRVEAMKSIKREEFKATPEQLIAILGDSKLPDDMRCFAVSEIHSKPVTISVENQKKIDTISTSILQNNEDGEDKLKLSILLWIKTRGTFGLLRGIPTIPPTAMKNLLTSENVEIRQKAIRFIREDDSTFSVELENVLKGKSLGKVTTLEALEGLARSYPHAPFNKEALIPLLNNESLELSTLAAQQLARSDERPYYHEKLRPLLTNKETPTAMKIATMEALTRSLLYNNQELHDLTMALNKIVQDKDADPELKENALNNLHLLITSYPPGIINREITQSLYDLHLSFLKPEPDGINFVVIDHEKLPKWAGSTQSIYIHLVLNYPEFKEKHEARRLIAEQYKLKKESSILHDKSQTPEVRHKMFISAGTPDELARFAIEPENDEKMPLLRERAIESLFSKIHEKQKILNPDLERFAKVVKQVSEEKTDSPAKLRAIQFKKIIHEQYPSIFAKHFPEQAK